MNTENILYSEIWGPRYWYVLHTIASTYPVFPDKPSKRKYYDFFMNLPLFIPDINSAENFKDILDTYPVSSYLDSRKDLQSWLHFIHNQINRRLGKPELGFHEAMDKLNNLTFYHTQSYTYSKSSIYICIICSLFLLSYFIYKLSY